MSHLAERARIVYIATDGRRAVLEGEGMVAGGRYRAGVPQTGFTLAELEVAAVDGNLALASVHIEDGKPVTPWALLGWGVTRVEDTRL